MVNLKSKEEIEILREGGQILGRIIYDLGKLIKPGITTLELDELAKSMMKDAGGESAFFNYQPKSARRPFPAHICISINDEIVHGIPNENPKTLKEGDLVTLDGGFKYKNLITDHAVTYAVGEIDGEARFLIDKTREALGLAIKQAVVGNKVGDISNAIQEVAFGCGLSIIEGLTGHGVGYAVHEDPYIPNIGSSGSGEILKAGMVIAIEPMFGLGSHEIILDSDGYTYKTRDGSLSAQFEHTVAITEKGPIILTKK